MAQVTISTGLAHSGAVKLGTGDKTHIHYMTVEKLNELIAAKLPQAAEISKVTLKVGCYYTLPNAISSVIYANITQFAKFCNEGSYGSGTTLLEVDKIAEDKVGTYTADITSHFRTTYPHTVNTTYKCFYVYSTTANVMVRNYYCPTIDLVIDYEVMRREVKTAVSPSGGGTVTGGGTYDYGTQVTLTAIPASGYKFVGWSDGTTSSTRTVTANNTTLTYTAMFELDKINKIYIGTSQPKKIYIGTQEVKAVYVGTTKVYG